MHSYMPVALLILDGRVCSVMVLLKCIYKRYVPDPKHSLSIPSTDIDYLSEILYSFSVGLPP